MITEFVQDLPLIFDRNGTLPWNVTKDLEAILHQHIGQLGEDYRVRDGIAIHETAVIEPGAVLKAPLVISEHCFVGAHAYLRGGVYAGAGASIGPGCEVKTSIILEASRMAHFNFIGDSIIGRDVNIEAGAILANHFNERDDKQIRVLYRSGTIATGVSKFGSLVGDHCRIGANAVLSPGTLLLPGSVVKRLELVEQDRAGGL